MRPIELTLQGLNSFRELQRVDFEKLTADGLFGIFGPTGSGKSTLLDAMTLALYGTVERAANHTQGIMNQLESELSVSFTFELNGAETLRYRAERSYKRAKTGGVRLSSCRLLRLGQTCEVLADKEREVTQKVQEILGLTPDDFTRAVVLPQGKFAEFLSLKGSDRRKMLQRLFHLEKYGDALIARLKERSDQNQQRLKSIADQLALLGDASKDALTGLDAHVQQTKAKLAAEQQALDVETQTYQKLSAIWDTQQELIAKQQAYAICEKSRGQYNEMNERLRADQAAKQLIPYLDALVRAEKEHHEALAAAEAAKARCSQAAQQEQSKKAQALDAEKAMTTEEPRLQEIVRKAQHGEALSQRLDGLKRSLIDWSVETKQLSRDLSAAEEADAAFNKKIAQVNGQIETYDAQIESTTVSSEEREQLQTARDAKNKLDQLHEQLEMKRADWRAAQAQWLSSKQISEQAVRDLTAADEERKNFFSQLEKIYADASSLDERIERTKQALALQEEAQRQAYEQQRMEYLASTLAENLEEGAPCPVCGAVHHPQLATQRLSMPDDWQLQHAALQQVQRQLDEAGHECRVSLSTLEQLAGHFSNLVLPATSAPSPQVKEVHLSLDDDGREATRAAKAVHQDVLQVSETLARIEARHQQLLVTQSECTTRLSLYKEKKESIEIQARELHQQEKIVREQWSSTFPAVEELEKVILDVQRRDKAREQLVDARREAQMSKARLEAKLSASQQKRNALGQRLNHLQGQYDSTQKQAQQIGDELRALGFTDNEDPSVQLKQATERLDTFQRERKQADDVWREAWRVLAQAEKDQEASVQRAERAQKAQQTLSDEWTVMIEASEFDSRASVQSARLDPPIRQRLEAETSAYQQRVTMLQTQIQILTAKLDGQTTNEETVTTSYQRMNELKTSVAALREETGALTSQLAALKERHTRYTLLRRERREAEKAADQLDKLQRVFRGNAFVAFVASEQLHHVCIAASKRLGDLTHNRYALESENDGSFVVCDNGNGGIRRPVSSLSGGETFLASLALALSLSEQIQLTGNVPLQFFFLDEGFGTLDPELLDTVLNALERLHMHRMAIGVISHVPEMRARLPRQLMVTPAEPSGKGSRLRMEIL
ncbi:MAG: SMC family ATPase [Sporolactobacillus sp.]